MPEYLLILIIFLIVAAGVAVLVYLIRKKEAQNLPGEFLTQITQISEKLGQQSQINLQQAADLQEIKSKLFTTSQAQDFLKNGIEKTQESLEELRRAEERRREKETEYIERIKRMDEVIAGTSTRGLSGEKVLKETFKKLPPEMIEPNFAVGGKIVEFALVLPNDKRIPIDSKWPAADLLLNLEKETLPEKREEIIEEIEKEVMKRIKEVKQYIDPTITWSQAIAAVPDSVFGVLSEAHLKARENDVILLPYSMVLPLLLYMYRLHLQYALSIDMENLQSHLISISRNLDEMEEILENKIIRGTTMVSNAYLEYKQAIGKMRASIQEIQIKPSATPKKLPKTKKLLE